MKMFVFEYIDQVSPNYHPEGGLMVIAKDKEQVEVLIKEIGNIEITNKEWEKVITYDLKNDEQPKVFVFPDAGCC